MPAAQPSAYPLGICALIHALVLRLNVASTLPNPYGRLYARRSGLLRMGDLREGRDS